MSGLAERHAVEPDVHARLAAPGHLGERRREPGGAEVLERDDEAALDQLEARLDELLAGERVADLHGRALVLVLVGELLAREDAGAADPVAARSSRRTGRSRSRSRARELRGRARWAARRCTSRSRAGSPRRPRRRPPRRRRWERRRSCRSGRCRRPPGRTRSPARRSAGRRGSAIGRAPMAMMSRRIPPIPVAAPWNGSTADGWLWLSTLKATASPSPTSMTPAFSPGPWRTAVALGREAAQQERRMLVAAVLRPEEGEDRELEVVRLTLQQSADAVVLPVRQAERAVERCLRDRAQGLPTLAPPVDSRKPMACGSTRPRASR